MRKKYVKIQEVKVKIEEERNKERNPRIFFKRQEDERRKNERSLR